MKAAGDQALLIEARQLLRALDRLTNLFLGLSTGWVGLVLWRHLRGSQALPTGLLPLAGILAVYAGLLWLAARRRISRWSQALDRRLGVGGGRALLILGRRPEGAFLLQTGRRSADLDPGPESEKELT